MVKSVRFLLLVLSIKCTISCLAFFELSLLSACSASNSSILFLKVVPFVLKM